MPIHSADVDEHIHFIGRSSDEFIIPWMRENKKTWARDSIDRFLELAEKTEASEKGIVLDIGANIGTTSVYLARTAGLKVIAFEPDQDNYKMLQCNCILNDVDSKIICENIALSNKSGVQKFLYDEKNPGGSSLVEDDVNLKDAKEVRVMKLDDYIVQNNVDVEQIQYIWMDTEGYEAEVIEGALGFLKKRSVPMFAEVNQRQYKKKGMLEGYISNVSSIYTHFMDMDVKRGTHDWISIRDITDYIYNMEKNNQGQTDFLMVRR